MMDVRLLLCTGALLSCLALPGGAQAAEQVVLESNGARYRAGETLASTAVIKLAEKEFVVLATEDGRLVRISGPHDGPANIAAAAPPSDRNALRAIAQLLGAQPAEAAALGGVRGGTDADSLAPDTRGDPWWLHAERTGDQCVVRDRPTQLWREQRGSAASAEVDDVGGGVSRPLSWQAGTANAAWPFDSPPVDNRVYLIRPAYQGRSIAIHVHVLAPELVDKGLATVAWLAARGCVDQAQLILRTDGGSSRR